MSRDLYALALTEGELLAVANAIETRIGNLEAVSKLAPSGTAAEAGADAAVGVAEQVLHKVKRAAHRAPDGLACSRCALPVVPQAGTPEYCSQLCWRQAIDDIP